MLRKFKALNELNPVYDLKLVQHELPDSIHNYLLHDDFRGVSGFGRLRLDVLQLCAYHGYSLDIVHDSWS